MTIPNDLAPQEREYLDGQYPGDLEHMFALLGADISLMAFTNSALVACFPPFRIVRERLGE